MPSPEQRLLIKGRAAGCLLGVCACFAEETSSPLQTCITALLLPPPTRKPSLVRCAHQAPRDTVPGEAAHTDLLAEASPLWGDCQKTAQPDGNCNDLGPFGKADGLENTWSLSFDTDGRSGEGEMSYRCVLGVCYGSGTVLGNGCPV